MARDPDDRQRTTTGRHRAVTDEDATSHIRTTMQDRVAHLSEQLAVARQRLAEVEKDMAMTQETLEELKSLNQKQAGALALLKWLAGAIGIGNIVALIAWALKAAGHP